MNLIIEDGTGVTGANSFASADDMFLYATDRNIEISSDPAILEGLLIKAMDYIESISTRFNGVPRVVGQPLPFPRSVMDSYGAVVSTGIPAQVKKAQIILAIAATTTDLLPVQAAGAVMDVTRKTVGPITVEYEKTTHTVTPRVPLADALLRPYIYGGSMQPTVIRG